MIAITFDEAGSDDPLGEANHVFTVLLGDMIKPGTIVDTPFNHYSLLRTIEENFQLGTLGKNDEYSNWFRFLWNESFAWSEKSIDTQFEAANHLEITSEPSQLHMVFTNETGDFYESFQSETSLECETMI